MVSSYFVAFLLLLPDYAPVDNVLECGFCLFFSYAEASWHELGQKAGEVPGPALRSVLFRTSCLELRSTCHVSPGAPRSATASPPQLCGNQRASLGGNSAPTSLSGGSSGHAGALLRQQE